MRLTRQELLLVFITMIWGGTFLAIHHALAYTGPLFFVGARFLVAALLLTTLTFRTLGRPTRNELVAGSLIGTAIGAGYALQTIGLQTIPSSTSAFITALYVPLVPLLQWLFLRRPPSLMACIGIALAFVGLILVANPDGASLSFGAGEYWTLASAVAIAIEIILISAFSSRVEAKRVTIIQLLVAALLAFMVMWPAGEKVPSFSWTLAITVVALGAASALIQFGMNWAQKTVSPTRATVIYTGEPVWAGLIGRIAGERLPLLALFGGLLIVLGVLVSELPVPARLRTLLDRRRPQADEPPAAPVAHRQDHQS
ncbi:permease of the drug/metabolite transporter superfamily [Deinococcus grandis]|uniref:Permease of the drug/metabolite transporter superfamily n=1 Tax=Deinococcus grandis TaxID=57498 RepID=A0A100HN13_9DEIO|nr:DMT family transporter [Deinococcus grandis]BBN97033.1 membrane protein [Deinococcus grandis]GAQ23692.1 permease of the drug/metabolite transporter superfamily [Deinococcus grandis]